MDNHMIVLPGKTIPGKNMQVNPFPPFVGNLSYENIRQFLLAPERQ